MPWTELRGFIAVVLVAIAIAVAWNRIEARPIDQVETTTVVSTTTTTTTLATTTTLNQDAANAIICELARTFADDAAAVASEDDPGPVARLALGFWSEAARLVGGDVRPEVGAVVGYYEDYLRTAEPFDFDNARIIVEGDKEKLEQLLTRPAPGLEESRALIGLCGVVVPDQPSMAAKDFQKLEDRVLDDR